MGNDPGIVFGNIPELLPRAYHLQPQSLKFHHQRAFGMYCGDVFSRQDSENCHFTWCIYTVPSPFYLETVLGANYCPILQMKNQGTEN